ncbi:MAG: DUF4124 domain-containing protein [Pseudomonadota bacterium]
MDFKKLIKPLILALAAGSFTVAAVAQWQWIDKDGRKVFSDRSPPGDIPEKSILKRPPGSARAPEPLLAADASAQAASAPAAKASAAKPAGRDTELEARKKKAEDEEKEKKKASDERVAKANADNCARARNALSTLQSGVRLSSRNDKGEREVFDDARREAESKRAQEAIDASCK